jgi:hypothetical protein
VTLVNLTLNLPVVKGWTTLVPTRVPVASGARVIVSTETAKLIIRSSKESPTATGVENVLIKAVAVGRVTMELVAGVCVIIPERVCDTESVAFPVAILTAGGVAVKVTCVEFPSLIKLELRVSCCPTVFLRIDALLDIFLYIFNKENNFYFKFSLS